MLRSGISIDDFIRTNAIEIYLTKGEAEKLKNNNEVPKLGFPVILAISLKGRTENQKVK